jgi:VWFA-related protein
MGTAKPQSNPMLVAVGLAACLSVPLASQSPETLSAQLPTFKAEVEYVEVDALVTDQRGAVVRDLRKEDFQILEDGKSQAIAGFAFVEIPIETGDQPSSAPLEPDVRSNERPFTGRVYVLILDDLHTASLRAQRVKRAAQQFIDRHLAENDLMAVVHIGGASNGSQEFTSDKRLLSAAVDRFMGQKITSATMARNDQFFSGPSVASGAVADPFDAERSFNARATTRVLTEVAEKLSTIRGRRKTILFISEGLDYDITDVMSNRGASSILDGIRDAIAAATRSNASIYAVDPRGLTGMADEAIEAGTFADQRPRTVEADPDAAPSQGRPGIGTGSLRTELQMSQDSLRILAEETNGFAAVNANDFGSAFERIVSANSAYYVLAYNPPPGRRDGRFHRIEVRTSRPGLTIRARRGYVVPKTNSRAQRVGDGDVSPVLQRALNSVVPTSNLKVRLFAAPFIGTGANTSVVMGIELRGGDLALADSQRLELAYVAVDMSGETRVDTDSFTFKLPAETKARIKQTGIRFLKRLNIPPGRYHFRVGAHDTATGAVGTVSYDLDLPAFSKLPFSMSGLLVSSRAAASTVTARGDAELQKMMNAPPVSLRSFPQNDDVSVLAEVYDRTGTTPHTVDIVTTIAAPEGRVVFERSDQRSSSELQGANGAYVHTARLPVSELAPGRYVLTVEARSRLGHTTSRQIAFDVIAAP